MQASNPVRQPRETRHFTSGEMFKALCGAHTCNVRNGHALTSVARRVNCEECRRLRQAGKAQRPEREAVR